MPLEPPSPSPHRPQPARPPMPIRSSADAVFLLTLALRHPNEYESLAFWLDEAGNGSDVISITETLLPDSVIDLVEFMLHRLPPWSRRRSLVVASIRPDIGVLPGDIDRWMEVNTLCEQHGAQMLEWFVVSHHGVECPRDLLGEPPRWPAASPRPPGRR